MKKITILLLLCLCAVGFVQAQGTSESQSITASVTEGSLALEMATEISSEPQLVQPVHGSRSSGDLMSVPMRGANAPQEFIARTSSGNYSAPSSNSRMANLLTEDFDDITTLAGAGYTFVNASDAIGTTDWAQGSTTVFDAQAGAPEAYVSANYNNTAGSIISNWMVTPVLNLENGDEITFWTRTATASNWPDRLEIRLSPDGSATAPASPTDVGSYTELLLEINPALAAGGYPEVWTEFTAVVSGLTGAVNTSVAFRYFVTDGGPTGSNSNYIGIDTLSIDEPAGPAPLAFPVTFEGQTVPFSDFNGSVTQVIGNPDASGANTSANVAENVVPANAAFAGVNFVIPVDLTDDKFFSMNVWSPLAGMPVLLKLEGGANPPIERLVNMTTTSAWEEIVFDFSSEGAITYDSVTLFMNFNVLDPASQTYYWDNLDQMVNGGGGGGGGTTCNQENPLSAAAGGALGSSVDSDFKTASDILVVAGEDFTVDTLDAYFLTFAPSDPPTTATVVYYDDAGGLPGAVLGTETVVPTILSAQPWANPVADQYETSLAVTPFTFAGDAGSDTTYWIEISMGTAANQATVFWEYTSDTPVLGSSAAQFNGTTGAWAIPDPLFEVVYNFSGECTPIGGGALALPITHESQAVTFNDFNGSATQQIANPDATGANTSATVAENVVPGSAGFAGVNIVVPIDLTDDKLYSMNVWSPIAGTPVLLKLEGGANPPIERQVTMTTSGAWEEVLFDFSSEGAVTYDSVTIFMNFNVVDPASQTYYWDNLAVFVPVADNDLCIDAYAIACDDTLSGDTSDGNTDDNGDGSADEWFAFTSTTAGEVVTASLCDQAAFDTILTVYDSCGGAVVASNDDGAGCAGFTSKVNFIADGSSTYYIAVDGFGGATGAFDLSITCSLAPANDNADGALPISCGEVVAGTTINASEDSAVAPTCDTTVTAPGVWYVYDDSSGLATDITITMCNGTTGYDSKLSVYTGDPAAPPFTCVTGNDDTCGLQSEVSFQSDGATTFYILVHGFGAGEGDFEIEMICELVPPPNDLIANSIDVDEVGFPYTDPSVATLAATLEAGSPVGCDNAGARGVWYNFVPTADGTATATIVSPGLTGGTPDVSAGLGAAPTNVTMGLGASGDLSFTVNNGPLVGSYDVIAAGFGGEFTADLITGDTVLMIDDDTTGDPNDACDPLLNGASLAGKIAIARRGACAFTDKVISAQNEGAIAVIVINNQPGGPIVMGGDNPDITIPALMLGDEDGEALLASFDTFLGLTVTSGAFGGSYDAIAAAFGGEFTSTLITGETVLMIDDDTTGDPNDACDPLVNGASLAGKIAIARRGACAFTDKVIAAQDAGAIMVIVINNQPGGPIVMGGANPDITIPALMIGAEDGQYLLNSSLAFNTVTFYTAPNEDAVETDLELVDWYQNQCLPGVTATIPTVAGQAYYVFVANHDGVTDIVIDGTNLGTEDNNTIEGFVYYPNPTQSTLNLRAQDNIESAVIYNMLGQKVFDQNVNATTSELNVSDLATGAYILQVSVNGQIGTYQILKK